MTTMNDRSKLAAANYLKRPYTRMIVPESDDTYRGEIAEFPGCIATGDTRTEALDRLEEVAESWLLSKIERGQPVPEPMDVSSFSGKLVLRLPRTLHQKAAIAAERDGTSLNQFISSAVAEQVGARRAAKRSDVFGARFTQNQFSIATGDVLRARGNVFHNCVFVGNTATGVVEQAEFTLPKHDELDWRPMSAPVYMAKGQGNA